VKHLRTYEFKPFVIFIKPPSLDRLRETRKNAKIISSKDDKGTAKPFTVSTFRHGKTWELVKSFFVVVYLENKGYHWISSTVPVRACTYYTRCFPASPASLLWCFHCLICSWIFTFPWCSAWFYVTEEPSQCKCIFMRS